jgi:hypothetical protein
MPLLFNGVLGLYENTSMDRSTWMLFFLKMKPQIISMVDVMNHNNSKQPTTHDPKKIIQSHY